MATVSVARRTNIAFVLLVTTVIGSLACGSPPPADPPPPPEVAVVALITKAIGNIRAVLRLAYRPFSAPPPHDSSAPGVEWFSCRTWSSPMTRGFIPTLLLDDDKKD